MLPPIKNLEILADTSLAPERHQQPVLGLPCILVLKKLKANLCSLVKLLKQALWKSSDRIHTCKQLYNKN